jgi:colanic acid biosynthesis glycosyl transferase WcaI
MPEMSSPPPNAPRRMRILIVSSYYHPEHAGNAPYVTGVAEHLAGLGHDVTVLTGFAHYPAWRSSARGRLGASERRNGVIVRRRWHFVPRSQSAATRAAYETTLGLFGLTGLPLRAPDAILGISPTLAAASLARTASLVHGRPYGLVLQDLQGRGAAQSGVAGGARIARFVERAEISLAQSAAAVGVIAEGFRDYLLEHDVDPRRIRRVRNWSQSTVPTETLTAARAHLGWRPDEFVCLHAGNMGHKQGLENVLRAASHIRDPRVRVVLAGEGNDYGNLRTIADGLALTNVSFAPSKLPGHYESMLAAADVLIVNQRASVGDMSLASKLTSYFTAARPIAASVAPESETAREVIAAGAGVLAAPDDPPALAESLLWLKSHPADAVALGTSGLRYATENLMAPTVLREYELLIEQIRAEPIRRGNRFARTVQSGS